LVLPAIAAREAGPASLLAWGALLVFCTPVALSFAEMSRQEPDAGGIAHFVTRAFGRRASVVAGYLFYFAIPFGAPATAVIGGNYIANALGGGHGTALVAAALLLAAGFASNAVGIKLSSRIQLVLMILLVAMLALAVAVAEPYARAENFEPFSPHGNAAAAARNGGLVRRHRGGRRDGADPAFQRLGAGGSGAAGCGCGMVGRTLPAASCPAASRAARTVASIIEPMKRAAISSSAGVNSAIAAPIWRASGRNMAPPSR